MASDSSPRKYARLASIERSLAKGLQKIMKADYHVALAIPFSVAVGLFFKSVIIIDSRSFVTPSRVGPFLFSVLSFPPTSLNPFDSISVF